MAAASPPKTEQKPASLALTLKGEGLVIGMAAVVAFAQTPASWLLLALLFLAPDLAMIGYAAGTRIGAICYNLAHSYIGPVLALALSQVIETTWLVPVALTWIAHIGFDRALGYGLKYSTGFKQTHLGRV